jgi:hypothetical protein
MSRKNFILIFFEYPPSKSWARHWARLPKLDLKSNYFLNTSNYWRLSYFYFQQLFSNLLNIILVSSF